MGHRVTQTIRICADCEQTPDNGEYLWEMCGDYICEPCIDRQEAKQQKEYDEEQ